MYRFNGEHPGQSLYTPTTIDVIGSKAVLNSIDCSLLLYVHNVDGMDFSQLADWSDLFLSFVR